MLLTQSNTAQVRLCYTTVPPPSLTDSHLHDSSVDSSDHHLNDSSSSSSEDPFTAAVAVEDSRSIREVQKNLSREPPTSLSQNNNNDPFTPDERPNNNNNKLLLSSRSLEEVSCLPLKHETEKSTSFSSAMIPPPQSLRAMLARPAKFAKEASAALNTSTSVSCGGATTNKKNPPASLRMPLKSALRTTTTTTSTTSPHAHRSNKSHHRVRGLWTEDPSSPLVLLHDELLASIFQFNNTCTDLVRLSAVSRRFHHVASARAWDVVDATDCLQRLYRHQLELAAARTSITTVVESDAAAAAALNTAVAVNEARKRTSATLATMLEKHSVRSLTIRNIGHCMTANHFLPSMSQLQELSLHHFEDLSDTAVHVLLLGASGTKSAGNHVRGRHLHDKNCLTKLSLQECPLLTNSVVRSIAKSCPLLQELSLAGCCQISDLSPLQDRLAPPIESAAPLAGLFAPPGTSPARRSSRSYHLRRRSGNSISFSTLFGGGSSVSERTILRLDVSRTAVGQQPPSRKAESTASTVKSLTEPALLFAPPPTKPKTMLCSLFAPPPSSNKPPTALPLTSLIAPPPSSPTGRRRSHHKKERRPLHVSAMFDKIG